MTSEGPTRGISREASSRHCKLVACRLSRSVTPGWRDRSNDGYLTSGFNEHSFVAHSREKPPGTCSAHRNVRIQTLTPGVVQCESILANNDGFKVRGRPERAISACRLLPGSVAVHRPDESPSSISGDHFIGYATDAGHAFGQCQKRFVLLFGADQPPKMHDAVIHDHIA